MRSQRAGWVCRSIRRVAVVLMASVLGPQALFAQPPDCPADDSPTIISGTITGVTAAPDISINLKPCQTLSVTIQTSDPNPWYGASLKFELFNSSNQVLYPYNWSILNTPDTRSIPETGWGMIHPYRGTRGDEGLPVKGVLSTTSNTAGSVDYTVTITKVRREGYNIGGSTFQNAPGDRCKPDVPRKFASA